MFEVSGCSKIPETGKYFYFLIHKFSHYFSAAGRNNKIIVKSKNTIETSV